jgi:hypothetical protein
MATFDFNVKGEISCKGLDHVQWDEERQVLIVEYSSTVSADSADNVNPRSILEGNTGARITHWQVTEINAASQDEPVVPRAFTRP